MKTLCSLLFLTLAMPSFSQGNPEDVYYQIPEAPSEYTPGAVAARVVDGLGFRYYWSTEGLTDEDLIYRPSEGARNVSETVDHIVNLTAILLSASKKEPYAGIDIEGLSFEEKRTLTLSNIQEASDRLKATNFDLSEADMIFESSGSSFPFWNLLNGPIADAINHVGQIITLRRTNGNPIYQKISVLRGTVYE